MSHVCSTCKGIYFAGLLFPTASDILQARESKRKGIKYSRVAPFNAASLEDAGSDHEVELGTLGAIRQRSDECRLCHLMYSAVKNQGVPYLGDKPIAEDDGDVLFFATVSGFYGYITESLLDTSASSFADNLFLLRRLTIRADLTRGDIDGSGPRILAYYRHVLQVCNVDDFENGTPGLPREGHGELLASSRILFGGRRRPDIVDINLLRRWLRTCEERHEMSCCYDDWPSRHSAGSGIVRFIDVENNCLRVLPVSESGKIQYAALSYVWGKAEQFKLTGTNEAELQLDGALSAVRLPQTIRDAIDLVRSLEIKFLWIDVLCIRQGQSPGDVEDRKWQLSNMATIYGAAFVTIFAACGDSAEAGLAGLRPGSRTFNQMLVPCDDLSDELKGLALVATCVSRPMGAAQRLEDYNSHDIDMTAWNTRGWTYQERCLSRRCIFFLPSQVHWICDSAYFCEESRFEHPDMYQRAEFDTPLRIELFGSGFQMSSMKKLDGPLARMTTNRQTFWTKYHSCVAGFSRRNLSHAGDVHDAFASITESLGRISGEMFHWGHPRSRFGLSISWRFSSSSATQQRRTAMTTLPMTSLNVQVQVPSWSWMGWIGDVNIAVDDQRLETETSELAIFEHQSSPIRISQIVGPNRFDDGGGAGEKGSHRQESPQTSPWRDQSRSQVTWDDVQKYLPQLTETRLNSLPNGHVLFFWASSAFFTISNPSPGKGTAIVNRRGDIVGVADQIGGTQGKDRGESSNPQEFVVVARRAIVELPDIPAVLIALHICWEDGIACRLNIAEIGEKAWEEEDPSWKLIALM